MSTAAPPVHAPTNPAAARADVVTTSGPSLAERLYAALLTGKPRLASRMTGRAEVSDIPGESQFTLQHLRDHLNGRETYATTLALVSAARAGCRDYDDASEVGDDWIMQALTSVSGVLAGD